VKSLTQVFLASLVCIKIFICVVFIFQLNLSSLFSGASAIASESTVEIDRPQASSSGNADDEEISLEFLVRKKNRLTAKEKELEKRNAELLAFQTEIDQKIAKLTKLRNDIKSQMARKEGIERQKIKHLIKAYAAMKPQSAAGLVERLDKQFAVELLSQMKGEAVGQILTYVDKDKAARLIEGLANRK
jgi:flagellar motility protein MotE (MotC chaperone)